MDESLLKDTGVSGTRRGNGNGPEMVLRIKPETQDEVLAAVRQLRMNLTKALADIADRDRALAETRKKLSESEALRTAAMDAQQRTAEALAEAQKEIGRREEGHATSMRQLFDRIAELEIIRAKYEDMQSRSVVSLHDPHQRESIIDARQQVTNSPRPISKEIAGASASDAPIFAQRGYPYFMPDSFAAAQPDKDFTAVGHAVHQSARSAATRAVPLRRAGHNHAVTSRGGIRGRGFRFHLLVEAALITLLAAAALALYPDNRPVISGRLQQTLESIGGVFGIKPDRVPAGFRSAQAAVNPEGKTSFLNRQSNVRSAASGTAPIVMTVQRGTQVETFERNGSWTRVRVPGPSGAPGTDGWIFAPFLSDTPDS